MRCTPASTSATNTRSSNVATPSRRRMRRSANATFGRSAFNVTASGISFCGSARVVSVSRRAVRVAPMPAMITLRVQRTQAEARGFGAERRSRRARRGTTVRARRARGRRRRRSAARDGRSGFRETQAPRRHRRSRRRRVPDTRSRAARSCPRASECARGERTQVREPHANDAVVQPSAARSGLPLAACFNARYASTQCGTRKVRSITKAETARVSMQAAIPPPSDLGEGIAQIRLPMTGNPLRYINGYVLEDDRGLTLVDCGWKADDVLAALRDGLRELGRALSDVRRILITHHHFDHYGLAATLRRAGVPELLMHARDWELAQLIATGRAEDDRAGDAWLARNGYVATELDDDGFAGRWELIEPTQLVADGERVGRLRSGLDAGALAGTPVLRRCAQPADAERRSRPRSDHAARRDCGATAWATRWAITWPRSRKYAAGAPAGALAGARRAVPRPRSPDRRTARAHRPA